MQIQKLNEYWKEGRYADLWSINHFLSGVVLGALLFTFGVSFSWSLLIALVLFVGWELVEILMGIKEHMPNMVTDVLFDMAGFLAVAWYFSAVAPLSWTAMAVIIIIFMIFNIWGFIAYEERKIDAIPKKLHTHL
jgi:hypothetical protein